MQLQGVRAVLAVGMAINWQLLIVNYQLFYNFAAEWLHSYVLLCF